MNRRALTLVLSALFILFAVYFGFRFRGFVVGPRVSIEEPEEGALIVAPSVMVRGHSADAVRLELNGRPVYVDDAGAFAEPLLLASGLNIIELKAEGRFGRTLRERRMVMV